jgi:iron-sulfur cluster assembly protein
MAAEILRLTESATNRVAELMAANPDKAGLRVWIKEGGCNGLSYQVDMADEAQPGDDVVDTPAGKVFLDPKSLMYILGAEMDFFQDSFYSGFLFKNPNESGQCGCGESFSVG